MVLQKRLVYGSRACHLPPTPHIPISAKGKRSVRRKFGEINNMCAFDLLATVAGNLLKGEESSSPVTDTNGAQNLNIITKDSVKPEPLDETLKSPKIETVDQNSCNESTLLLADRPNPNSIIIKSTQPIKSDAKQANANNDLVKKITNNEMDLDVKPVTNRLVNSSDSSSELPLLYSDVNRNDDDDNSSGCTDRSTLANNFMSNSRIRKLFATNKSRKTDAGYSSKKRVYTRQRTERAVFKRKKLFGDCSISVSNGGMYGQGSKRRFGMKGQKPVSYGKEDYHVKLSIKSFKVPELLIEIPETATIGSLKRRVMEAVTAIMEGELKVGVLVQGKKVRDDNRTLKQVGICNADKLDNLGFSLEPKPTNHVPDVNPKIVDSGDFLQPLASIPPAADPNLNPIHHQTKGLDANLNPVQTSPVSISSVPKPDSSVHSPIEVSSSPEKSKTAPLSESKEIVLVPAAGDNLDELAIVPARKLRRMEMSQRRIRRPFSVAEVEALVQAVELLGTGRWRDVKIRAFDNAKHRTYVDLKDKWKTLVHTASISPQQRRGEPVPQELLDRVLMAQAYWSKFNAKSASSPSTDDPCFVYYKPCISSPSSPEVKMVMPLD